MNEHNISDEDLNRITEFDRHWEIDWKNKTIRRKYYSKIHEIWSYIWPKHFEVGILYRWMQKHLASEVGIVFQNAIDQDQKKFVTAILPRRYTMENNYQIERSARKNLVNGPLIENDEVIIPPRINYFRFYGSIFLKTLAVLGSLASIIGLFLMF